MKVVVAGGTGLVGRHVAARLVADGAEVVVLSRNPERHSVPGAHLVAWLGAVERWRGELCGADAIVNLTGESVGAWPWTRARKRILRESRLGPVRELRAAVAALPAVERPAVFVSASGCDVYVGESELPANEDAVPADTFLARLCLDWEAEARSIEVLGPRVVILRLGHVLAAGAPLLRLRALPVRLGLGGPFGSGDQWLSWIAADDVATVVATAITEPRLSGPVNVSTADIRERDFVRALGRVLHRPTWFRAPAALVRLLLGGQASLVLDSRRLSTKRLDAVGFRPEHTSLDLALRDALRCERGA